MSKTEPDRAKLCLDSWAGRVEVDVLVRSTAGTKATIELLQGALLPRRGWKPAGVTVTVPMSAISRKCRSCKGEGSVADYVGDDMRCIETGCPDCMGSGRATGQAGEG